MRRIAPFPFCAYSLLCTLTFSTLFVPAPARAAGEIAAEPAVIVPGQTVKLRWYFTGNKVTVSGGRFAPGTIVTGKTLLSDTPKKTTKYTFDVYYSATQTNAAGEKVNTPVHATYYVTAQVDLSPPVKLTSYKDTHGWKIDYLAGWEHDVSTPDTGSSGLIYFQKEYDSVERMAVAVLPAAEMTLDDLVKKIQKDVPSGYAEAKIDPEADLTIGDSKAKLLKFTGMDMSHPGTRTTSEVIMALHDGRAWFVSVRCSSSNFALRQRHLERMMKSFVFLNAGNGTLKQTSFSSSATKQ